MRYCQSCILPNTRPNLSLDKDGICTACRSHGTKPDIDWKGREKAFEKVAQTAKSKQAYYDCIIPVSGGKDSTWQVVKCLDYGLRPLAVTWRAPRRTELGQKNLDNLISLGVDHIDYSLNPKVEKIFTRKAFEKFGTPAIPMHMAIYNLPLTLATRYRIPLVVWGENSAFEYGGDDEDLKGFEITPEWLKRYGVTHGTTASDWADEELSTSDLRSYEIPSPQTLKETGVRGIFMGYYFQWDPVKVYEEAARHGFQAMPKGQKKTGIYEFADIDDDFLITIHHFMKWYKFGFTRIWDNLSLEIRNGRIGRQEALEVVRESGDEMPLGEIDLFCRYLDIDRNLFWQIVEKHRNLDIWEKQDGRWVLKNFLFHDWKWEKAA